VRMVWAVSYHIILKFLKTGNKKAAQLAACGIYSRRFTALPKHPDKKLGGIGFNAPIPGVYRSIIAF
jgi:hypothetical protein